MSGRAIDRDPGNARISRTAGVVEVGTAWDHSCVRAASGEVLCWGDGNRHGENGAAGDGAPIPARSGFLATRALSAMRSSATA